MKNFDIMAMFPAPSIAVSCGTTLPPGLVRHNSPTMTRSSARQPRGNRAQPVEHLAELYIALFDDVVVVDDEQIAAALVRLQRAVRDKQGVARAAPHRQADPDEKARQQVAMRVGEHAAHQHRPGRGVDRRRDVFERAVMRRNCSRPAGPTSTGTLTSCARFSRS